MSKFRRRRQLIMKEHKVIITETLRKEVVVAAKTPKEALRIARENWDNGDYILDAEDFKGVTLRVPPRLRDDISR